jgi:hypothetical protein
MVSTQEAAQKESGLLRNFLQKFYLFQVKSPNTSFISSADTMDTDSMLAEEDKHLAVWSVWVGLLILEA